MVYVETNGAVFRTERVGGGSGHPLLLIHELGGDMDSWDPALAAGLCDGRPGLRFDWRGAGKSEKTRGTLSIDDMCADIAGVLDETGFGDGGPVDVLGIALGGGVGIAFAVRYPERVRRLVSTSSAIGGSPVSGNNLLARADGVEQGGMRPFQESSHKVSFPEHLRTDPALFAWYRAKWLSQDPGSFAAHNRMLASMDETPNLPRVQAKTLVLSGTHDPLRPPPVVKEIAAQIPGAAYEELDTGHFMHVQAPALCVEKVTAFLDGA